MLKIGIPSTVTTIEDFTFQSCESLKEVSIPSSVNSIGEYAFSFTALNTVTLPESLKTIGKGAFYECEDLEKINIPANTEVVGDCAFMGCAIKKFIVQSSNQYYESIDGVLFDKTNHILCSFPRGSEMTSFYIPDGTEDIEEWAFYMSNISNKIYPLR